MLITFLLAFDLCNCRCGTAPAPFRPQSPVTTDTLSLPGVLQFESWWTAGREQQRMSIYYHTATGQFHIRCGVIHQDETKRVSLPGELLNQLENG